MRGETFRAYGFVGSNLSRALTFGKLKTAVYDIVNVDAILGWVRQISQSDPPISPHENLEGARGG